MPDIVSTSCRTSRKTVTQQSLIDELKDTCRTLEATIKANSEEKIALEERIKGLEAKGLAESEAEEDDTSSRSSDLEETP